MDVTETLDQSLGKLVLLSRQRDAIEHQMGKLHLAIRGLTNLVEDKAQREAYRAAIQQYPVRLGITDLVVLALNTFDKALTPREIRDFIVNYGSDVSTQQNLLQSTHTIIKRMEDAGDVKPELNEDGDKAYRRASIEELVASKGVEPKSAKRASKRIENIHEAAEGFWEEWLGKSKEGMISLATLMNTNPDIGGALAGLVTPSKRKTIGQRIAEGDDKK
jgi:hypothetical protein